jgi:hypothetical protein
LTVQLTAAQVGELVAAGRYWWYRPPCLFLANNINAYPDAPQPGDLYLLDASPDWVAQWDGDWQAAADQINPFMSRIPGIGGCSSVSVLS